VPFFGFANLTLGVLVLAEAVFFFVATVFYLQKALLMLHPPFPGRVFPCLQEGQRSKKALKSAISRLEP
jgi:hypothetical protein